MNYDRTFGRRWMLYSALTAFFGQNVFFTGCADEGNQDAATGTDGNTDTDADGDSEVDTSSQGLFDVAYHLASEDSPNAPGSIGIVTWSVEELPVDAAEIRFGLTADFGMAAPVDLAEPDYRTLLLGMKPSNTYYFQVVVTSGGHRYASETFSMDTGPSTNLVNVALTNYDKHARAPGFVISTVMGGLGGYDDNSPVFIADADGDIVWWYISGIGRTCRAMMSYDGKSMWLAPDRGNYESAALQVVSMDTLENQIFDLGASHDMTVVDENTIAYIDYGEGDCGSVFEMDREGNTVEIFESQDYLPGYEPPECHLNAIDYNQDRGLYTVSDRNIDIFVINRQGEIQWRLTDIVDTRVYQPEQHGHHLLDNSILLFANEGGEDGNSAAIEFSLDDGSDIFRYDPGIFSVFFGDAQRLTNGNTMVTFSIAGVIHEVDANGNLLMEMEGDTFGYSKWRPTLYGPPPK